MNRQVQIWKTSGRLNGARLLKTELFAVVDQEDYDRINEFRWYYESKFKYPYRIIRDDSGRQIIRSMAREVLDYWGGSWVRHSNKNRMDCRRENLSTGSRGWNIDRRRRHPYKAEIQAVGYRFVLGYWPSEKWANEIHELALAELPRILEAAETFRSRLPGGMPELLREYSALCEIANLLKSKVGCRVTFAANNHASARMNKERKNMTQDQRQAVLTKIAENVGEQRLSLKLGVIRLLFSSPFDGLLGTEASIQAFRNWGKRNSITIDVPVRNKWKDLDAIEFYKKSDAAAKAVENGSSN